MNAKSSSSKPISSRATDVKQRGLVIHRQFEFQTFEESAVIAERLSNLYPFPINARLGLTEIFYNAIEHGNLGIKCEEKTALQAENRWVNEIQRRLNLPENRHKKVHVQFDMNDERIITTVKDEGVGFDWQSYENERAPEHRSNGRGIFLAKQIGFDELNYHEPGNRVDCINYLSSKPRPD